MRLIVLTALLASVQGRNDDLFNYGRDTFEEDGRKNFGQPEWEQVTCSDLDECTGFAETYPHAFFKIEEESMCRWCPESGNNDACGLHHQSPINLKRNRAELGGNEEKECPDWHYMQTRDDTCDFDDIRGNFVVARHALQLNIPQNDNGEIDCEEGGQRMYPRLDYSKGFPDWWWMERVDVMAPSNHRQEGVQYPAEVVLAHFYETEHYKNQLGHISIFLKDLPGAEPWAYLDKFICQWRLEEERVRSQCGLEPVAPYGRCELFRGQPATAEWLAEEAGQAFGVASPVATATPTAEDAAAVTTAPSTSAPILSTAGTPAVTTVPSSPPILLTVGPPVVIPPRTTGAPALAPVTVIPTENGATSGGIPPAIECSAFNINFERMCMSKNPCCASERKDTTFCWESYEELGDAVESACYHCCPTPMLVGPGPAEKPNLPKTITCSDIENPHRMCKPDSCCTNPRSDTPYCKSLYDIYNVNELAEVCHYCCSPSQEVGPPTRRNLRSEERNNSESKPEARVLDVYGRRFVLGPENFEPSPANEEEHFEKVYADHKRRSLQQAHSVNYEDIEWLPYEWLLKVGTEYYYRYEGTMLVPPCWETVHWRVMKDPIIVHSRQIAEINRLLAWRLDSNSCEVDTAGVVSDDGNSIRMDREVQYMHKQHRQVFCECKDWPSKFEGDRQWCDNWEDDRSHDRFYRRPYSFESGGQW